MLDAEIVSTLTKILPNVVLLVALLVAIDLAWNLWMHYINKVYLNSIEWVMLEIIPPKEVFKSPQAMELVLGSLYGGDATNAFLKYWKGELGQMYSLEIASIEGKIHFYVRFHKKFRKGFEAQLYSQYPQATVIEVEDYTTKVPEFTKDGPISLFGYTMKLAKPDPYPIKSYIDFGLDKAVGSLDEEQRIDPITPILETMGSIGIGEQIWMQIIMQKEINRHTVKGADGEEEGKSSKDKAKEILKELKDKVNIKDPETGKVTPGRATRGEQLVVEAVERHMNKPAFDCGIRVVYLAPKENFSGNTITAFTAMFRQFISEDLNTLKIGSLTKPPDEPWKDSRKKKLNKKKKDILEDYKQRQYLYGEFKFKKLKSYFSHPATSGETPMLLSVEEIATLWHLPGKVVETPTFTRIETKKSEPPANLPI